MLPRDYVIALACEFADAGLRLGIESQLDELFCHLGRQHSANWIEEAFEYWGIESLHGVIVPKNSADSDCLPR